MTKKNKDGYYRASFYHNGKQYTCRGATRSEADGKAALKRQALENGEIGISKNMSVARWCYDWLDTYKVGITE